VNPVIVVGAGISGVAAARELRDAGLPVVVLDRGRRIGGRMASRTIDGRPVDIGASYFTASDPTFEALVADWQQRGLAHPWTDTFQLRDRDETSSKAGPMRWGTPHGLRSLVEDLAAGLEIRSQTVTQIGPGPSVDGAPASAVLLAMPDPQARRLLGPAHRTEAGQLTAAYAPVLALTASWPERAWADVDGVFVNGDAILSWVADDGRRRGDAAPVLVAHSTTDWANQHLSSPEGATAPMVAALRRLLEIPGEPVSASVHRWTFAKPSGQRDERFYLSNELIGACGDGWGGRPRVEGAFGSGQALGRAVASALRRRR
jgi:predicted NAD/FAD-dependent oxidoreductase